MLLKYIWFTMWISAVQHSDSVIHIYTLFFIILFHYGLSQDIEYSPMCYTGGSCCNVKTTTNMFPGSCSSTELPGAQVDLGDTILGSVCFWLSRLSTLLSGAGSLKVQILPLSSKVTPLTASLAWNYLATPTKHMLTPGSCLEAKSMAIRDLGHCPARVKMFLLPFFPQLPPPQYNKERHSHLSKIERG